MLHNRARRCNRGELENGGWKSRLSPPERQVDPMAPQALCHSHDLEFTGGQMDRADRIVTDGRSCFLSIKPSY